MKRSLTIFSDRSLFLNGQFVVLCLWVLLPFSCTDEYPASANEHSSEQTTLNHSSEELSAPPAHTPAKNDSASIDNAMLGELNRRLIPGTTYFQSNLHFALQEDGTDDKLWRMLSFDNKLLYDLSTAVAYIAVEDQQDQLFGIIFPQELREVAYGWEDEEGFPFTRIIYEKGVRYVSIFEIAEKNGALAFLADGYGDVYYFPKTLLDFMEANYPEHAGFSGHAWRQVYLNKRNHE